MNLLTSVTAEIPALSLGAICLRLLCAMVVGTIIGTEREYTHRPAGLRTHILVALGACSVMITSQLIFTQYSAYGATPDPARLSAQVITGVGFLGAGTILREGSHVKGLTTAASLWAVACLGIAAGGGYYTVALAGTAFIFVTLTLFELFLRRDSGPTPDRYQAQTHDISAALSAISTAAQRGRISLLDMSAQQIPDGYRITFRIELPGLGRQSRQAKFFRELAAEPALLSLSALTDDSPVT